MNKRFSILPVFTCYPGKLPAVIAWICSLLVVSCKTQEEVTAGPPDKNTADDQFRSYFHDALAEKMIGHYDRAVELLEACLLIDENSDAVHFALSDLYELQGDKNKALASAEKAYELDQLNKWYALRLAHLHFDRGDFLKSATFFDIGITEEELNLDLKFKYAEALIYSNQYQKAIDLMDQIEVETGKIAQLSLTKHDMYLALGEEEKAADELNSLMAEDPSNTENRIIVAEYFLNTNQTAKAKAIAEETIRIDPEHGASYVILADVALREGNIDAAFSQLKIAFVKEDVTIERKLELLSGIIPYAFQAGNKDAEKMEAGIAELFLLIYDPALKNPQLHSYYGSFLQMQGKTKEALAQYKIVCALNASDFKSWNNLLNTEYALGAYTDMFADGQKAIELFPSQPMFYLLTGIGAYESGNFDSAEEFLFLGKDLVVKDNELVSEFYYHLGKVSGIQKNYTEAFTYLEEAKKAYGTSAKPYGAKAKFLYEQGKTAEAESEIRSGLAIDPNNSVVLDIQGIILLDKKDYAGALKVFEKAAVHDYTNGTILEHYGDALYLTGEEEKAVQTWIEAEKNGNNSTVLKRKIADQKYYEN